jgi:uncharacterized protein
MALRSKAGRVFVFILLFWAYAASLPAVTPPLPDKPAQYVVDLAGVLDAATEARLNARLKDLEAESTAQVVVLTLNSLEGEPIENFSHQTAVKWGIGQKGKDNGVLLTVAVKDRKYRLEVGYGLESVLPDSLVGSLGREYLVPNFKKGDFAAGIVGVVTALADKIAPGKDAKAAAGYHWEKVPRKATGILGTLAAILLAPLTAILFICFIILLLIVIFSSRWNRGGGGYWVGGSGGGSSWGGSSSGGFSGGGGDFGGGGSSGDW